MRRSHLGWKLAATLTGWAGPGPRLVRPGAHGLTPSPLALDMDSATAYGHDALVRPDQFIAWVGTADEPPPTGS